MQDENRNLSSNQEAKESIATKIYMTICAVAAVIFVLFVIPAVVLIAEGLHENKLINSFSKAINNTLWVSEEPLIWFRNGLGQWEENGKIKEVYFYFSEPDGLESSCLTTYLEHCYHPETNEWQGYDLTFLVFNQITDLSGDVEFDQHNNKFIIKNNISIVFTEYSESEFTEKYPQFNLFTLGKYEKEHKVGDYREK